MTHQPVTSPSRRAAIIAKAWCRVHLLPSYSRLALLLAKPLLDDLARASESNYRQLEAMLGLYETLAVRRPLPPLRGWAISPDFGLALHEHVIDHRPTTIVEFGSGISTVIAGYALKALGGGRIISFDHDADWRERSVDLLRAHGLSDLATVHHAPLIELVVDGEDRLWYDVDWSLVGAPIDLLVVDGPPVTTQHLARYPALPLAKDLLASDGVVMLDDAERPDERRILSLWQDRYGPLRTDRVPTEKGCVLLRRPATG